MTEAERVKPDLKEIQRKVTARAMYLKLLAAKAEDKTAFAVGLGQDAPPGTVWRYNNSAIQTLSAVLRAATGRSASDLAAERLLAPIGMAHSRMTQDRAGNTLTFMGL